ncbi:Battenin [Trichostrongylus colubriformis]|uniref:Battenin n=1 Tax=Trichostrongylus colubriformis TaxID=6319 RepID=A0AAN8F0W0_TRICO
MAGISDFLGPLFATMTSATKPKSLSFRNLLSFWIFGLCNNFAYSVMLSAAQDILNKHKGEDPIEDNITDSSCVEEITYRICSPTSTGVVLICNILPGLCVKMLCPLVMHRIPYWVRHTAVCVAQASSLFITAFADSVPVALGGVCLGSFSSGLGETTYLGLAGHYSKHTIATWSSGTGMAGVVAAFSYAGLTDQRLMALSPAQAMLVMLVVPAIFMFTFYTLLEHTDTMKRISFTNNGKSSKNKSGKDIALGDPLPTVDSEEDKILAKRLATVKSLLRYMIPLFLTYFAEYLINQGLLELTVFDCQHGFGTSPASQYRWYQVLYQVGVFVSRSSINVIQMNMLFIALMPVFQLVNTAFFMLNAIYAFIPNFGIVCAIVLYEGLIGGGSYVNTFHHIHKKVILIGIT